MQQRNNAPLSMLYVLLLAASTVSASLHIPHQQFYRKLEIGDFKWLNELWADAQLQLPDNELGDSNMGFNIRNLYCTDLNLGDIQTSFTNTTNSVTYSLAVDPFALSCYAEYDWVLKIPIFPAIRGNGRFEASTRENSLATVIAIQSPTTFELDPPATADIASCSATIGVDGNDVKFSGKVDAQILNLFKGQVADFIGDMASKEACNQLQDLGATAFKDLLNMTNTRLDEFIGFEDSELADPLFAEKNFTGSTDTLLDFGKETSESIGDMFVGFLREDDALFGETADGELGINKFLRDSILDDDGVLMVIPEEMENFDPVLFYGHDDLTETALVLDGLKVVGLDTLQSFEAFNVIGNYTISNKMRWESLSIEVNLTADIMASSLPTSLLISPSNMRIRENITLSIDLQGLDVDLSIFMGVNEEKLDALRLGSLLTTKNVLPCIMSAMEEIEISGLDVTVKDMSMPNLTGFVSPGLDRVLSQLADVAIVLYEPTLLQAIPGIFQGPVRKILKERFVMNDMECPELEITTTERFLDFRDLFLEPEASKELGGNGDMAYGNIGHLAYKLIQDRMTDLDDEGLPYINEMIIRPATESQSGRAGYLNFEDTLFEFTQEKEERRMLQDSFLIDDGFNMSVGNLRVANLDNVVAPIQLLEMTNSPYVLRNNLNIGDGTGRPLNVTMRLNTAFEGFNNELDLSVSVDSVNLFADVRAKMDAKTFLNFPLGEILDYNCWLAALPPVEMNAEGFAVDASADRSLSLEDFRLGMSAFKMKSECIECESSGMALLPELIDILETAGAVSTLGDRLPPMLESVSRSDVAQTTFDRMLVEAPKFCPTSPEYDENAVRAEYDFIGLPTLDAESIDTLLFSGVLAVQTGFVVIAETQRAKGGGDSDPLSAQNNYVAPDGIRLLDWTDIGNSTGLGGIADQVFKEARQFINGNGTVFDFDLMLEDVMSEEGELKLDTKLSFEEGDLVIAFEAIKIRGLDSMTLYDVFEPIGPQTLSTSAQFDALDIEIVLSADSPSTSDPPQELTVKFSVENTSADISLFAAFDLDKVGELQLGSLLDTGTVLQCITSAADRFEIPQMKVQVGTFSTPVIDGLFPETNAAATATTDAIFDRFGTEIEEAIPLLFDGVVKGWVETWLGSAENNRCEQPVLEDPTFVDFRDLLFPQEKSRALGGAGTGRYGDLISAAFEFFKKELFVEEGNTGLAVVNSKILKQLTESQSGTPGRLSFDGNLFSGGQRIAAGGLKADVELRAFDAYINNIDTFGVPMDIIEPVAGEKHLVNNSAVIGVDRPLEFGLSLYLKFAGDDTDIENEINFSLGLRTLKLLLTGLATVSEKSFMEFPVQDIMNLQCWLATIPPPDLDARGVTVEGESVALSVIDFMASVSKMGLNASCVDCSGPKIAELGELLSSLGEESEDVAGFANGVFDFITKLMKGNFLQVAGDRALSDARMRCPHSPEYDPDFIGFEYEPFEKESTESSLAFFVALMIVLASVIFIAVAAVLTTKLIVRRRHRAWIAKLSASQLRLLSQNQSLVDKRQNELDASTVSMFQSDAVPVWLRFFMPIVIIGNIIFFLSGHLSLGASVSIIASLGGQSFEENGFFEFSMLRSTLEIWKAGARELAIMIFIFSFAWPYLKQVITLALWFTPPTLVSVSKRGSILMWLDFLAKWSMVDVFVLAITIVIFRVSIQSPNVDFMPSGFYSLDLLVVPKWGLYANMTAQIISQLSSHFIIHYHRKIIDRATPSLGNTTTAVMDEESLGEPSMTAPAKMIEGNTSFSAPKKLCNHAFRRPHRGDADKLVIREGVNPLLLFLSCTLCILVAIGCSLPSYSLKLLGIIGVLVESGQNFLDAHSNYTVFTTIGVLFDQAKLTGGIGDFIGLGSLSILVVVTVLLVPMLQCIALLVQWFLPLTKQQRYQMSISLEILQAWQYAEVYLLAVLVGSWQLAPISAFMVNPYCSSLDGFFAEMVYYGILKKEDAQCLRADVAIEPTFYILFSAAILLALVNTFVMKAVAQHLRDEDGALMLSATDNTAVGDLNELDDFESDESLRRDIDVTSIHPTPVLFTDRFRWFLHREDAMMSRQGTGSEIEEINEVYEPPPGGEIYAPPPGGEEQSLQTLQAVFSTDTQVSA